MSNKRELLAQASENFTNENYGAALQSYALLLKDFPNLKEAYNCAILSEMALSGEAGAEALFDYYEVLKNEDKDSADVIIAEILSSLDGTLDNIGTLLSDPLKERLSYEDGILYEDFLSLLGDGGSFHEVFENIMFSTKVIITTKEDFIDFIGKLLSNGFKDMALSYIEGAVSIYPNDPLIRDLVKKFLTK
ncbi:MAG: hypothetical protein U9N42_10410 [Campylobacterota bacterium]|nr:hypothetical protein [Campylobacterota bacterium]